MHYTSNIPDGSVTRRYGDYKAYSESQHGVDKNSRSGSPLEALAIALQTEAVKIYDKMTWLLIRLREKEEEVACGALPQRAGIDAINSLYRMEQLLLPFIDAATVDRNDIGQTILQSRYTDVPSDFELKVMNAQMHGVDKICIRMPYLPTRKSSKLNLIYEPFSALLYKHRTEIPTWSQCRVDFIHIYPKSIKWMPRDVDNYAYKRAIDLLAFAVGFSDCPMGFETSQRTVFTDEIPAGTYIEVTPKSLENEVLPEWI